MPLVCLFCGSTSTSAVAVNCTVASEPATSPPPPVLPLKKRKKQPCNGNNASFFQVLSLDFPLGLALSRWRCSLQGTVLKTKSNRHVYLATTTINTTVCVCGFRFVLAFFARGSRKTCRRASTCRGARCGPSSTTTWTISSGSLRCARERP